MPANSQSTQALVEKPVSNVLPEETREQTQCDLTDSSAFSMSSQPVPDDLWRTSIGLFDGDPLMKEILEESRAIRTAQRTK